ncbi:MAG: hypothetical protein NC548_28610 [Lachnospiraceae bacterium]|nr:hypothetical protein [Lachnospiraceae bacterium]
MLTVFAVMGFTNSYVDYIMNFCSHNPVLRIRGIDEYYEEGISITRVTPDLLDVLNNKVSKDNVYPVFIETPADQILKEGIKACSKGDGTYVGMAQTFLADDKTYSASALSGVGAYKISTDNACDAAYEFLSYVKKVVAERSSQ